MRHLFVIAVTSLLATSIATTQSSALPDLECNGDPGPCEPGDSPPWTVGTETCFGIPVVNSGDSASGDTRVGFYIGISSNDFTSFRCFDDLNPRNPGQGSIADCDIIFDANDVGRRFLNVWIDDSHQVGEGNEGNNQCSFGPFLITESPCRLTLETFPATDQERDWGEIAGWNILVKDDDGAPQAGATITFHDPICDGPSQAGPTNEYGIVAYTSCPIPDGDPDGTAYTFNFTASAPNCSDSAPLSRRVIVAHCNLELQATPKGSQSRDWGERPVWDLFATDQYGNIVSGADVTVEDPICGRTEPAGSTDADGYLRYEGCPVPDGTADGSTHSFRFAVSTPGCSPSSSILRELVIDHPMSDLILPCCMDDGECLVTTVTACCAQGGLWNINVTSCEPNPCPDPSMAAPFFEAWTEDFSAAPECPDVPGDYTVCSYSPNNLWGKVSWSWDLTDDPDVCNLRPENVSVQNSALVLTVPQSPEVAGGQVTSLSANHHYGTYSAQLKMPSVPGTVSGFFIYREGSCGDENEIDIEYLSSYPDEIRFTVHGAGGESEEHRKTLPEDFDPTGTHRYSFRWEPELVTFYIDDEYQYSIGGTFVPKHPGVLAVNHWTGNDGFGEGPPSVSADFEVESVMYDSGIRITAPNGGEEWSASTFHTITWDETEVQELRLEYTDDDGATWQEIGVTPSNTSGYLWQVPGPPSLNCKVRISDAANSERRDESNYRFSIEHCTKPFGTNAKYGSIPAVNTPEALQSAQQEYEAWVSDFVRDDLMSGGLRVRYERKSSSDTEAYTASEGIGYGMLLAAYFGDRDTFEGLLTFYKNNLNNNGLMIWRIPWLSSPLDVGSATDGDEDVAMALLVANYQWEDDTNRYLIEANSVIRALYEHAVTRDNSTNFLFLPGDTYGDLECLNPSYFAPAYYTHFQNAPGQVQGNWGQVREECRNAWAILANYNSFTGLIGDWVSLDGELPFGSGCVPTPDSPDICRVWEYALDASRIPWRAGIDVLWTSSPSSRVLVEKIVETLPPSSQIGDGYYVVTGKPIGDSATNIEICGQIFGDGQDDNHIVSGLQTGALAVESPSLDEYYQINTARGNGAKADWFYQRTVKLLSMFVYTGNFWSPEIESANAPDADVVREVSDVGETTFADGSVNTAVTLSTSGSASARKSSPNVVTVRRYTDSALNPVFEEGGQPSFLSDSRWTMAQLDPRSIHAELKIDLSEFESDVVDPQNTSVYWRAIEGIGLFHQVSTTYDPTETVLIADLPGPGEWTLASSQLIATESCCFSDGRCTDLVPADCTSQGGVAQGMDSSCSTTPCAVVVACCYEAGNCDLVDEDTCVQGAGFVNGQTCDPSPCVVGACCLPDGSCDVTLEQSCLQNLGGTYIGEETCSPDPCVPGACCGTNDTCTLETELDCLVDGAWNGSSSCDPNPCLDLWSDLFADNGQGMDDRVNDLITYNGNLVACGTFDIAGSAPARKVARWDGSQWHPFDANSCCIGREIRCMEIWDDDLIIGGRDFVYRWTGSDWEQLGESLTFVYDMIVYQGNLVAASADGPYAWDGSSWSEIANDLNGQIYSLGLYEDMLVVGGSFDDPDKPKHVAQWDGVSDEWAPLGAGAHGNVFAICQYYGDLIIGGDFEHVGVDADYIAVWDGVAWSEFGGGAEGRVHRFLTSKGHLLAVGMFEAIGVHSIPVQAKRIASWDGSTWTTFGSGLDAFTRTLAIWEDDLYVGGDFEQAGSRASKYIAAWTGPLPEDTTPPIVTEFLVSPASGPCLTAFSISARVEDCGSGVDPATVIVHVISPNGTEIDELLMFDDGANGGDDVANDGKFGAIWSSTSETPVGELFFQIESCDLGATCSRTEDLGSVVTTGCAPDLVALEVSIETEFIAPGDTLSVLFEVANESGANSGPFTIGCVLRGDTDLDLGSQMVAGLDPNSSMEFTLNFDLPIDARGGPYRVEMTADAEEQIPEENEANNSLLSNGQVVVETALDAEWWDGFSRGPNGQGMDYRVNDLIEFEGDLFACGRFRNGGSTAARLVARWDGDAWNPVGDGITGTNIMRCMTVWGDSLVVGGDVLVGVWNGSAWVALGAGLGFVYDLVSFNGSLIAATPNGAKTWNGSEWINVANGLNGATDVLKVVDGVLLAGGSFSATGDGTTQLNHIARWDGGPGGWEALGSGVNGNVFGIGQYDGEIVIGGDFTRTGEGLDARRMAVWDGKGWSEFAGGATGRVHSFLGYDGHILAVGMFERIGPDDVSARRFAEWNGSTWTPFGNGLDDFTRTVATWRNELYVGGIFKHAGISPSSYIGRWTGGLPSDVVSEPGNPSATRLTAPRPNPSGSFIEFELHLETAQYVRVSAYDVRGKLLRRIVTGSLTAGIHELRWDLVAATGHPVPKGVYYLKLETGTTTLSKKVVVVQ